LNLDRLSVFAAICLFLGLYTCKDHPTPHNTQALFSENDSVSLWINSSKNASYSLDQRKQFLIKAYHSVKAFKTDSLKARKINAIAYRNLSLGDTTLFKKRTTEALSFAEQLKDSFAIGDAHWNFAGFYIDKQVYDSAYHHFNAASKIFEDSGYVYQSAITQYGMAFIKGRFKDYSGSEVLTFKAIKKFEAINNSKWLFSCYDHLGTLQNDIYEYDKALFYYDKASKYLKNNDSQFEHQASLNNIGNTYLKKGDYPRALKNFNRLLKSDSLEFKNKSSYARAIDNKAYCQLLMKDTVNVFEDLNKALQIRTELENKGAITISNIHLAHYFAYAQDTLNAIRAAKEANRLAKDIKNSRDYLETLSLLADLDPKNSTTYLKRRIEFNDSIQIIERKIQNKFTRIAFETDYYIKETKRLKEQKIWITVFGLILSLVFGLLIFIWVQVSRNRYLLFENDQQKANEQVYLVTLKQQEKLENEKIKERNRISEELHDGVLGKLFGTRINLGFLDIKGEPSTLRQYRTLLDELQTIEKEIREVSHKLSDNMDSSQINFSEVICNIIENRSTIGGFKYNLYFDTSIDWGIINQVIKVNLFRIIQEALQNIIKHASAKNVSIHFSLNKRHLILKIKDDGIGFNIRQKHKGIGMKNMKSRIRKLNGKLNISSKSMGGTILTIHIPKK